MQKIKGSKLLYESFYLRIELCTKYHVLGITWLPGISLMNENQLKSELKNLILVVRKSSFEKILIDETNFSCINNLNINLCFYQLYKNRLSDLNLRVGILKHTDDFHTFNSCQVFCQKNANCKTFQAF